MLCNCKILRSWLCLIHCTALHFKIVISAWEAGCCTSSATTVTVKDSVWRPCAVSLYYSCRLCILHCSALLTSLLQLKTVCGDCLHCSAIALLTLHYSWRPCVRNCCRKGGKGHNHSSYLTKMKMILMNRKIQNISFCSAECRVAKTQWRKQFEQFILFAKGLCKNSAKE